ncbi:MAG: hypothetical protein VW339_06575, partial [Quisquiliibacterium sp.]
MDKYFRKYIWDDQRTPYRVSVSRLSREQARHELLFYATLSGVLFILVTLAALSSHLPHGNSLIVSFFAFTQVCASLLLGVTRNAWAAGYCASAPLAMLLYFWAFGFQPNLDLADKSLLVLAALLWTVYAKRLVSVARRYSALDRPPRVQRCTGDILSL